MVIRKSIKKLKAIPATVILLVVVPMIFGWFQDIWAEDLQWKEEKFNVTFVDADVRDVLTDILKRNNKTAVFMPGVQGVVTFDFRDNPMLIEAAFNKILAENNLAYVFDVGNNTVKVLQADSAAVVDDIFTPKHGELQSILDAFARLGLGDRVRITADHVANVLFFRGASTDVTALKKIAAEIDASLANIQDRKLKNLEQQRLQSSVSVEEERAKREKEGIDAERSVTVEVVPLRYANVAQSTTSFQGEKVTLPGIMDSLQAFVGPITVYDASKEDKNGAQKNPASVPSGGRPVVSVDIRTNSIIVQGTPDQIKKVTDVVKKLDKEVPLVEIEVMIVAGAADTSQSFGVRLGTTNIFGTGTSRTKLPNKGLVSTLEFESLSSSTENIKPDPTGAAQVLSKGNGLGAQFIYRGTREFLEATIDNLASNGKMQTVASPRVVTLNNLPANISNTVKTTNLATSSVTIGNTQPSSSSGQSSVEAGVTLVITPSVIHTDEDDGTRLVRLAIDAKNTKAAPLSDKIASTSGQGIQTNIIIPDGATFILGGLFNTTRSESHSGVPFLKDLPVVGNLFGSKESKDAREETVFFITPKVFSYKDIVTTQGVRAKDYVESQRSGLDQEQRIIEKESQLLSIPVINVSDDE